MQKGFLFIRSIKSNGDNEMTIKERLYKSAIKRELKDKKRVCCNAECGWIGKESKTVHPKHWESGRLCPVCHEVTEPDET